MIGQKRYISVLTMSPIPRLLSSPSSGSTSSAKAEAVVAMPTQSGMIAFARSACERSISASAAACRDTAATSFPRETATLPRYSAEKPIAAERADIDGTRNSTTLPLRKKGEKKETATAPESTTVSTADSCGAASAAASSMLMSRCILFRARSTVFASLSSSSCSRCTSFFAKLSSAFSAKPPMPFASGSAGTVGVKSAPAMATAEGARCKKCGWLDDGAAERLQLEVGMTTSAARVADNRDRDIE
mmetsp:Transcript_19426/g.49653  ORF Transcript_19426/g.49653 Transcript_19426/m.49653 type:complete len:246 (-) Transcript_19426:41-778(-)